MAESHKGAASTAASKNRSPLLDDEIGEEFLTSWKSTTTVKDVLDFDCKTVPHGAKKAFSFDKMEMDFALEGGFDKISSFTIDMSDLDFSSPPRKAKKLPKERSGKEANVGRKHEAKQDQFRFNFDIDELDNFDLDSSFLKGEKKADKSAADKGVDCSVKDGKNQDSRNSPSSIDMFEHLDAKNLPNSDTVKISNFDSMLGSQGDLDTVNDAAPHTSGTHVKQNNPCDGTSKFDSLAGSLGKLDTVNDAAHSTSVNHVNRHVSCDATSKFGSHMGILAELDTVNNAARATSATHEKRNVSSGVTSKFDSLMGIPGESVNDVAPRTSATYGKPNMFDGNSPEIQVTTAAQESQGDCNKTEKDRELSETEGSTAPYAQHDHQGSPIISVTCDDSVLVSVPDQRPGVSTSDAEVGAGLDTVPNMKSPVSSRNSTHDTSYDEKYSSPTCSTESQNNSSKFQKRSEYRIARGNDTGSESSQSNRDITVADITNVRSKLHIVKDTAENQSMAPKVTQSPFHREPKVDKLMQKKGKGQTALQSMFLKKAGIESQVQRVSASKKLHALADKKMENMCSAPIDEKSQEFAGSNGQPENQKVGISKLHNRDSAKSAPAIMGKEKNDKDLNASGSQVHAAKLLEQMRGVGNPGSINPKLVVSRAPIRVLKTILDERHRISRVISEKKCDISPLLSDKKKCDISPGGANDKKSDIYPLTADKRNCNISGLKISRSIKSNSGRRNSVLQHEMKSVTYSEKTLGMHVNMASKVAHSVSSDMHAVSISSLKRKSFEGSTADLANKKPLERITESPPGKSKVQDFSQINHEERVPGIANLKDDGKDISVDRSPSTIEFHSKDHMTELEVPVLIENDGNVQKAEACARELEDICNILKKRHDEAKELLVRAIVNNNLLLMLNHPIYEDKISFIYVNSMTSKFAHQT